MFDEENVWSDTPSRKERLWLEVKYSDRIEAKNSGAKWSPRQRCWFLPADVDLTPELERFNPGSRIYLQCSFEDRKEVKAKGARWDPAKQKWFILPDLDRIEFEKWLPADDEVL